MEYHEYPDTVASVLNLVRVHRRSARVHYVHTVYVHLRTCTKFSTHLARSVVCTAKY
jgi:hypothetical protein